MSLWRRITVPALIYRIYSREITIKSLHNVVNKNVNITYNLVNLQPYNFTRDGIRYKSNKKQNDSDDEDEITEDDSSLSKDSKLVKFSSTSMRTDMILKSALSISRNKVEQMFYESKIRINGKKVLKKSAPVRPGDELDVIKMVSPKNPDHLYVARVEIINVAAKDEAISITARRFKNLLIENYKSDPHNSSAESES